jgi:hypothetical protein
MTQGKSMANLVMGVGTFTGTKPVGTMPTKLTEEDELKRKDLELKRLKEKEEEAARKREELMKAKAEEQKRCVHSFSLFVTSTYVPIHYSIFLKILGNTRLERSVPWNNVTFARNNSEKNRNKNWRAKKKRVLT